MQNSKRGIGIVGVGASAGGVQALQELFAALPDDLGLAYVVVVHLSPHHESDLAAILGRKTRMAVVQVADDRQVEIAPNQVYVIPPDRKLELGDGTISASPFDEPRGQRAAIDWFYRSLAASHRDSFAVILSGGGSDGTLGAKAVKEAGGLVLVQEPREATHDAMPRAAIAAGIADVVLPVRELASRLAELARSKHRVEHLMKPADQPAPEDNKAMRRIFEVVRARTGHDFSQYKRTTILRRLARRMQLNHQSSLARYLHYLKENPDEVRALFDDLLISVTTFFRDPEAWEALRVQVIGPLVEASDASEPIRAWVSACATGEEAYSLAMLFREAFERLGAPRELIIFASDIDEGALAVAREGRYPAAIRADVTEPRLARFFHPDGDQHYRVAAEIRESVVFALHSVLRDPPFSRLHLLCCRNLLIYLDKELQHQVQGVFRYALRDDGYLVLGVSESADDKLFQTIDKQHRIFRVRGVTSQLRLPQVSIAAVQRADGGDRERSPTRQRRAAAEVHLEALESLAPASLLVDEGLDIVHLSPSVGRFLLPPGGTPTRTATEMVRPELVDELRAALNQVFGSVAPYLSPFVPVPIDSGTPLVALLVRPHRTRESGALHALVMFLEAGEAGPASLEHAGTRRDAGDELIKGLREKLRHAEQRLQGMRQEHSSTFEDLRAANEELQSLNEEYRSTTEELETSKEELQSVNEELQTVNSELKDKLEEVSRAHNDLENFVAATDLAMLFLDRDLCIKRYTPRLAEIFNIKPHDHGRPIADLTHNLVYEELGRDARRVLADLVPIEREVSSHEGVVLAARLRPYRTAEDKIDGVVVTFVD